AWPLMPDHVESARFLAPRALLNLILVTLGAALTLFSWAFVGGQARFESYFVINCYYVGVSIIFMTLIIVCALGIVKIFDPALYALLSQTSIHIQFPNEKLNELIYGSGDQTHSVVFLIYTAIVQVGFIAVSLWLFLGWGAFREINGLSKLKSFIAGMIFIFFTLITLPIALLIQFAMD
ncbi:MAG TPA: hypothetical protein VE842_19930, partial [Pyrinomonadaceae bacterium]|nr:hypothetical protein [Pyrinomonadaceae bacterium]